MKWIIAPVFAAPMVAEAVMGPDLWFKFSFAAGALLLLVLILMPERVLAEGVEEDMPLYMDSAEVIAFRERYDQRAARLVGDARSARS